MIIYYQDSELGFNYEFKLSNITRQSSIKILISNKLNTSGLLQNT